MAVRTLLFLAVLAVSAPARIGADEVRVLPAQYPEGPLWQGDRLYYAEMRADRIMQVEGENVGVFFSQAGCGPTAIAPYGAGFLVLCHLGRYLVAVDSAGREIRRWTEDRLRTRLELPNDASADGQGGVYFSAPRAFTRASRQNGWVMYLSADGEVRRVTEQLAYPNGVHVAGDVLYVSEHFGDRILRYQIEAPGRLGRQQVFVDLAKWRRPKRYPKSYRLTGPDGLEIGPDGNLYVTIYGEGRLLRFSPEGQLLGMSEFPARYLTNVAFGGPGVAVTGALDNSNPPFPGEVRIIVGGLDSAPADRD
jgi:gluconolactonase